MTIDGILQMIGTGQDAATAALDLPPVPPVRFGTLPNGEALGRHTELARQAIVRAITTMVHDLQHFDDGVQTFRKGFNVADVHAREDLDHITMDINSVQSDAIDGWKP